MGLDGCKEILKAYKETILPADDPVSMNVCRISERILAAAGLGHVKTSISVPAKTLPAAAATDLKSDTGSEASQDEPTAKDGEWEIFVIKDDNIENAFVLPGESHQWIDYLPLTREQAVRYSSLPGYSQSARPMMDWLQS